MNRRGILLLILADLVLLGLSGYLIWTRYEVLRGEMLAAEQEENTPPVVTSAAPVSTTTVVSSSVTVTTPEPPPVAVSTAPVLASATPPVPSKPQKGRLFRRTFSYAGPSAATVHLVGDFNKWKPQALRKGKTGKWSVVVTLPAGDYSYNFIVDGKTVRDPNQRRTDAEGRSLLTVAP